MTNPILQQYIDKAADMRMHVLEQCAIDLMACAGDPDFRIDKAAIIKQDQGLPASVSMGICWAEYNGERVGPKRTWRIRFFSNHLGGVS